MYTHDDTHFKNLSNWARDLAELDRQIAVNEDKQQAWLSHQKRTAAFDGMPLAGDRKSEYVDLDFEKFRERADSLRDQKAALLTEYRRAYLNFADEQIYVLDDRRERSPMGELATQCGFVVAAVLDSFFSEFERVIDHHNATVNHLLIFSEALDLADQSKGDQEPLSGLGIVRLSDHMGHANNGIRVGHDEARYIDVDRVSRSFIDDLVQRAGRLVEEILDRETEHALEWCVPIPDDECEYVFEASQWNTRDADKSRSTEH